jgi:hypothetical protein
MGGKRIFAHDLCTLCGDFTMRNSLVFAHPGGTQRRLSGGRNVAALGQGKSRFAYKIMVIISKYVQTKK